MYGLLNSYVRSISMVTKILIEFSAAPTCLPRGLPGCFSDRCSSFCQWLVNWFRFRGASAKRTHEHCRLNTLNQLCFCDPSAIGRSAAAPASASALSRGCGYNFCGPAQFHPHAFFSVQVFDAAHLGLDHALLRVALTSFGLVQRCSKLI